MIKKSLKYLLIAGLNGIVLTFLLALWTDKVELTFNSLVRPIEFLKLIGISILALAGMMAIRNEVNRRGLVDPRAVKMKYSIILTLLISSYFYIAYTAKFIDNIFDQNRRSLALKIEGSFSYPYGASANDLSRKEYALVAQIKGFPEIAESAQSISFTNRFEGSLPDFSFDLKYEVPESVPIEEIFFIDGQFSKKQSFEVKDGIKSVSYSEVRM